MTTSDLTFNKLRAKKLVSLAEEIQTKCPGLSRYYMFKAQKITQHSSDQLSNSWKSKWCMKCGNPYNPENMKVRLISKIPLRSKLRKLLKKYFLNPHSLGKYQSHAIARYLNTKNEVRITCQVCYKKRKIQGRERTSVLQTSKREFSSGPESCSNSNKSLSKILALRLKKKKQKQRPTETNTNWISNDSPLLTSTPSLGNVSLSSNNSKWESMNSTPLNSTPLNSKCHPLIQSSQKKKKLKDLKKLLDNQKMESEDSLTDFLQSVS